MADADYAFMDPEAAGPPPYLPGDKVVIKPDALHAEWLGHAGRVAEVCCCSGTTPKFGRKELQTAWVDVTVKFPETTGPSAPVYAITDVEPYDPEQHAHLLEG